MSHPLVVNVRTAPPGTYIYVGRRMPGRFPVGSVFGNPFRVGRDGNSEIALAKYRAYLERHPELVARARAELRGKVLGCWCAPKKCHAEILTEIANEDTAHAR